MIADPAIDITVADRPSGARSAARLNRVTRLGPIPVPMSSSAMTMTGIDYVDARITDPVTRMGAKHSRRAHSANAAGKSATEIASTAEPMPITP